MAWPSDKNSKIALTWAPKGKSKRAAKRDVAKNYQEKGSNISDLR